jgi:FkbH-like protein
LDPNSALRTNSHGCNVLLFRHQDLGEPARRQENLQALAAALISVPPGPAPYLVIACAEPGAIDFAEFAAALDRRPNLYFLPAEWIAERYPVAEIFHTEAERLGAIPYTENYFTALAASIVRAAHAHQHPPAKVLALDCDNTLWQGICGEDGPDGVRLTPGHEALQRFAVVQRSEGTLIVLVSKNNLNDVEATFATHPEFPLRWEDITAHAINWDPKPANLVALASQLSLGLDSFVFLDDNSKEVAEVARELPQVVAIECPSAWEELTRFPQHLWMLDRLRLTDADRGRAASYENTQAFGQALSQAQSLEEFYQQLDLQVEVRGLDDHSYARAAQLTQRTNQFNFTTIRRTEAEMRALWDQRYELFRIDVTDRFGDYGFTGLLLGQAQGQTYRVDTFLLSCRVLGRGVEHAVMRWLAGHAQRLGLKEVSLPFVATAKNQPAAVFLQELGAQFLPYLVPVADLAQTQVRFQQELAAPLPAADGARPSRSLDYARIARSLASVAQIQAALRPTPRHPSADFATETESKLAALWAELLPAASIQPDSNFFELGGHSLLAVLLLTKVSEAFQVDLGIDEAYSIDMTLERMARRIDENIAYAGLARDEYQAIFEQIDQLSDEEVEALLLEESSLGDALETAHAHPARL